MKKQLCNNEKEFSIIMEENLIKYRIKRLDEIDKRVDYIVVQSKSQLFRILYNEGLEVCDIARLVESHYSFVYGVISTSSIEIRTSNKESKASIIRKEYERGKTIKEISKELNTNYSYVFSVVKKYRDGN